MTFGKIGTAATNAVTLETTLRGVSIRVYRAFQHTSLNG